MRTVSVPVIRTEGDLREALVRIEGLMRLPDSDVDEIRLLGLVIQDYETEQVENREPDPVEILEFVLSEREMSRNDLIPYIGSESRINEIFERKRSLTVEMIRKLSNGLGIPGGALIGKRDRRAAAYAHRRTPEIQGRDPANSRRPSDQ